MKGKKEIVVGVIGILVSLGCMGWLLNEIDFSELKSQMMLLNPSLVITALFFYFMTFFLRGWRWQLMLNSSKKIRFMYFVKSVFVGFTGNNVLPARIGELLRVEHFSFYGKVSRVTSISSIAAEKIMDAVIMLSILIITALLSDFSVARERQVQQFIIGATIFTGILVLILVVVKVYGLKLSEFFSKSNARFWYSLGRIIFQAHDTMSFIKPNINLIKIFAIGVIVWILEGLMFVVIIYNLSPDSHYWLAGMMCIGVVNFGIAIPSSPGYLGVFQAATVLALSFYGIDQATAFIVGFVVNMCQIISCTPFGFIFGFSDSLKIMRKNKIENTNQVSFSSTS